MEQFLAILRRYLADAPTRRLADDDLWTRFRGQRDEAAFRVLLERVGGRIFARCRGILGDDHLSEEAFQEAFCALIRHRNKLPTYGAAVAWLYTTATNKARALARQRRRLVRREQAKAARTPEDVPPASPEAFRLEEAAALTAALVELPMRQRRALELVYLEGMTHDEAARALGWSRGTVGTYVSRGLEQLRAILERRGLAALAGGAALEAALAVKAPALSPDRAATLAAGALKLAEMTPLPLLLVGKAKLLAGLTIAAGLAVGGVAYLERPAAAPSVMANPPKPAATAPTESVPERNLRLFRAEIQPRMTAALRGLMINNGDVSLTKIDAYDTRIHCWFDLQNRLDNGVKWVSHIELIHNTQNRDTATYMDLLGTGQARSIDATRPIVLWRNPLTRAEIVVKSVPLERAVAAFNQLPHDERSDAEEKDYNARMDRTITTYLGVWYAKGDARRQCQILPTKGGGMELVNEHRQSGWSERWGMWLDSAGRIRGMATDAGPIQPSPDNRRLDFAGGDWWTREPIPAR